MRDASVPSCSPFALRSHSKKKKKAVTRLLGQPAHASLFPKRPQTLQFLLVPVELRFADRLLLANADRPLSVLTTHDTFLSPSSSAVSLCTFIVPFLTTSIIVAKHEITGNMEQIWRSNLWIADRYRNAHMLRQISKPKEKTHFTPGQAERHQTRRRNSWMTEVFSLIIADCSP